MTFDEAAKVLGVKLKGLTENEVRGAFARGVKLAHPDVGGGTNSETQNLDRLKKAKDTLLRLAVEPPEAEPVKFPPGMRVVKKGD